MSRKKADVKRNICEAHQEIIDLAEELEEIDLEKRGSLRKLQNRVKKIKEIAKEARCYGQSMENRLSAYRSAIEDLDFTRNKL